MRDYMIWRKKKNATGKLIIGTVAGIAAGFAVGILTAPRAGKETRDILSARTSDVLETAKATIADSKNKVVEKSEEVADKVSNGAKK